jgi:metal-responsive CopG/Arc/MetJ family transcriptional regulator
MPNVRGDKRRTIVCPDDLWDGLGAYAAERSTTRGAVIRDQIRTLIARRDWAENVTITRVETGWQVRDDRGVCGTYAQKATAERVQEGLIQTRLEAIESGEEPAEPA